MLDPEYLANLPEPILRLWRQAEQRILADMARRISTYDYWIPAADHQSARLRVAGRTQEEILALLAPVTRKSEAELRQMMIEAGSRCLAEDTELYKAAGLDVPNPAEHSGLTSTLNAGYQQTAQTMRNLTRSTAQTATRQFENALDRAWLQVSSGAFDYDSAIRGAVKDLAEAGVAAIRYPSGRVDSIETAIRRAVLTGINQTAGKLSMELADEVGCDLVEVSAHAGARPEHALWQGRIYSRSGKSEKYPDFVASTGYGTGAGLCGWNCRHSFGPYVEGAPRAWTDEKLAELNEPKYEYQGQKLTEYEAQQKENYFNRQIHRWNREAEAMRAAGQDPSEVLAKSKEWRARKKDFLENRTRIQPKIILKPKKTPKSVTLLDVTSEYIANAKPHSGQVTTDAFFNPKDHDDEIRVAKWLNSTFGGDILVLGEKAGQENPDYLWNNKFWDLKTPESTKNLSKRIQKGLSQIHNNPGGIVCDVRKLQKKELQEIEGTIYARMKTSLKGNVDVIIIDGETLLKINRYRK